MKKILLSAAIIFSGVVLQAQQPASDYPITPASIRDVVLTDNFWLPKIKLIQDTTIQYAFDKCDQEGRMENFLIAGGKKQGKVRGKYPFDDSDLYKIIEGASYSLISKPNQILDAYLDSIIDIIRIGQEPDGYLTTWFTIDPLNPPTRWMEPSKNRWVTEATNHELYNSGHLFEAASAHYSATGKRNFLDIAIKNADLLVANFGPGKLQIPPGHQIIETGLIKLYRITHNLKYLQLSKNFLDWRGNPATHKLYGEYGQDHIPVIKQDEATGHAVRAVYMYAAMTDIAALTGDQDYLGAVNKIWENMTGKKMYLTGGIGSNPYGEKFGKNYELPNQNCYCETCAAIGSVLWNQRMFMLTGNAKYCDILERTLYNGLISGLSLDGTRFFYANPLESDGKTPFYQETCERQPWFDCSCCPTNLIRFIPSVPGLIYASDKQNLYINLFMSNHAHISVAGKQMEVSQKTGYPWDGKVEISVDPEKNANFTLKLRVPGWAQNKPVPGDLYAYTDINKEQIILRVNGQKQKKNIRNGYFEINRQWQKGDKVELIIPMPVRRIIANEKVAEDHGKVAFERGPIVFCCEGVDNGNNSQGLVTYDIGNINYMHNPDLLKGIGTLQFEGRQVSRDARTDTETAKDVAMKAVPYYAWNNRGMTSMAVWLPWKKMKFSFINKQSVGLENWKFSTGDIAEWAKPGFDDASWKTLKSGSGWEAQGYDDYKGIAWYRIKFQLPSSLKNQTLSDSLRIWLGRITDCDQTFLNGQPLGQNGELFPLNTISFPDFSKEGSFYHIIRDYVLPVNDPRLLWNRENVLAVRVRQAWWWGNGLVSSPLTVVMKDIKDYLSFDFGPKTPAPKPDGTTSRTIKIQNLSPLPEIKGTLTMETFTKNGSKTDTQTRELSLNKNEVAVTFTAKSGLQAAKTVYTFTEAVSGDKVVYEKE